MKTKIIINKKIFIWIGFVKTQFTLIPTINYEDLRIVKIIGFYFINFRFEIIIDR